MSSIAHKYADFSASSSTPDDAISQSVEAVEEQKLQSFEEGYQAGWADATRALQTEQQRITSEFAQNIQDMSFTYHEALSKMTGTFRPLMEQIVARILPKAAKASLMGHIAQELNSLLENQIGGEPIILVAPESLDAAKKLLASIQSDTSFKILAEPTLSAGQVYLKLGKTERELDLDTVTQGITDAIEAFFNQIQPEESYD